MAKSTPKKNDTTANLGFEAKLWAAADALRNNMDAAEHKNVFQAYSFVGLLEKAICKYQNRAIETVHKKIKIGLIIPDNVRAKLHAYLKRILCKYSYPPVKQENAMQALLEQAKGLPEIWTVEDTSQVGL